MGKAESFQVVAPGKPVGIGIQARDPEQNFKGLQEGVAEKDPADVNQREGKQAPQQLVAERFLLYAEHLHHPFFTGRIHSPMT